MKTKLFLLGVVVSIWTVDVQAQPPGPRGDGGGPPSNPIIGALDADGDHEITFDEISQAVAMLKGQDTNGDKKLSGDEMAGIPGPAGGPGRGGRGGPRRGGPRGGNDGGRMAERLMGFDKNKDGKLAADEVPERMQRLVKNADKDKDGFVDKDELAAVAAQVGGDGDSEGRGNRGRYGRGGGRPGGRGPGGPGGRGGPPNPEMMVKHAFEFDADKNGQLSKTEMEAFAKQMGQNRRAGGGRPDRGGPGGRPGRPQ
jgi:Ca2+-binding EF-hand superfamily protein